MLKYKFIRLEDISCYEGWELVEIVPAKSPNHYTMGVIRTGHNRRCVFIDDLKQKIRYHPEIGTYITEEDIDLAERA